MTISNQRQMFIDYVVSRWLGTPYVHLGRLPGVRGDCIASLVDAALHFDLADEAQVRIVTGVYSKIPNPRAMKEGLERFMQRISKHEAEPGDWFHIAWRRHAQHIALYEKRQNDCKYIFHASDETGKFISQMIDEELWSKIVYAYRFSNL